MKQVSSAYKNSMRQVIRNRSYVEVVLENVNTEARGDGAWSTNGQSTISSVSELDYKHDYGEYVKTLELNRWELEDGGVFIDGAVQDGYSSLALSDENGDFAVAQTIQKTFTTEHTLSGITVICDTRKQIGGKISVAFVDDGGNLIESGISEGVQISSSALAHENIKSIMVMALSTLPYHRFRIEEIIYGYSITFTNNEIESLQQNHDVDPLSRRLPSEKFSFKVIDYEHRFNPENPNGLVQYIYKHAPVSVRYGYDVADGEIEWVEADRYFLNGKPTFNNNIVTFSAASALAEMTENFDITQCPSGSKTLYDLAIAVLTDANLALTRYGGIPWVVDDALKGISTTGMLQETTHANCLQLIAHAGCCELYTDDQNVIHIKPFSSVVNALYKGLMSATVGTFYSTLEDAEVINTIDFMYSTLELNQWELDGDCQLAQIGGAKERYVSQGIADDSGDASGIQVIKTFDNDEEIGFLKAFVGEGVLSVRFTLYDGSTQLYSAVADVENHVAQLSIPIFDDVTKVVVSPNELLPNYRFRLWGFKYRSSDFIIGFDTITKDSQTITKIDNLKGIQVVKYTYSGDTVTNEKLYYEYSHTGEIDVEDNLLITSDDMAEGLAEHVSNYLKMRNTYDINYRGNPELETRDVCGIQTNFVDDINAIVLTDEISFNGALHGKLKLKGMV